MESRQIAARRPIRRLSIASQVPRVSRVLLGGLIGGCLLLAGCGVTTSGQKPTPAGTPPPAGGAPPTVAQPGTAPPGTTPPAEGQPVVQSRRHRFDMDSPANDDFSAELPEVHIYIRPYEDYLSMKIQGREGNRVRILWLDSEFVDIIGRRYTLVPPGTPLQEAAYSNIPPLDVVAGQTWSGKVVLLDEAQARSSRNLNMASSPSCRQMPGLRSRSRGRSSASSSRPRSTTSGGTTTSCSR